MTDEGDVLWELTGTGGDGLRVVTGEPFAPNAADLDARSWMHTRIEVRAHPFAGIIETVYMPEDVAEWRATPRRLRDGESVTVGGERAPEVHLARRGANVEIAVTPNGDGGLFALVVVDFDAHAWRARRRSWREEPLPSAHPSMIWQWTFSARPIN